MALIVFIVVVVFRSSNGDYFTLDFILWFHLASEN